MAHWLAPACKPFATSANPDIFAVHLLRHSPERTDELCEHIASVREGRCNGAPFALSARGNQPPTAASAKITLRAEICAVWRAANCHPALPIFLCWRRGLCE
jgi:hypothetical protein